MQNQHDEIYKKYRAMYNNSPWLDLNKPVDIALELSSHCNLRCPYCYHADNDGVPFLKGMMDKETGLRIIKDAYKLGVYSIKFNWRGESTLSPNFLKFTRLAHDFSKKSIGPFIDRISNTNFNFLHDRDDIFEALSMLSKLKVSIDSLNKTVYETQRARGDFDLICKNLDKFHDKYSDNTILVLQAVRTNLNKDEDLENDFKKRWPKAIVSIRDCVDNRTVNDHDLSYRDREKIDRIPCRQAFARLVFDWKGNAFACCPGFDEKTNKPLKLGNINDMSIEEIFNSSKAKSLRLGLKEGWAFKSHDVCKNCSSYETYAGYQPSWDS